MESVLLKTASQQVSSAKIELGIERYDRSTRRRAVRVVDMGNPPLKDQSSQKVPHGTRLEGSIARELLSTLIAKLAITGNKSGNHQRAIFQQQPATLRRGQADNVESTSTSVLLLRSQNVTGGKSNGGRRAAGSQRWQEPVR